LPEPAEQWLALLRTETDPFKLTIRGCAAIEADMDAYCDELFRSPMPDGMTSLGLFAKRLPVAAALGVVPANLVGPMKALWKVRNQFAHGDRTDLSERDLVDLRNAYASADYVTAEAKANLDRHPEWSLTYLLIATRAAIRGASEYLLRERDDAQRNAAIRMAIDERLRASAVGIPSQEALGIPAVTSDRPLTGSP
jgi:hypothetical protein